MITKINRNPGGYTLVEIMIVVAIIGLLAAIAVPSFFRARQRSQATTILNELRMIDSAKDQYALENNKSGTVSPGWDDLTPYLKAGSKLATNGGNDSLGYQFIINDINTAVQVSSSTKDALSSATDNDNSFWGPYS
jgi:prepilin-type N-terminal cleavage/methylation domain-containing protein